jgi:nucleotide-binding universal stress UspA family protein
MRTRVMEPLQGPYCMEENLTPGGDAGCGQAGPALAGHISVAIYTPGSSSPFNREAIARAYRQTRHYVRGLQARLRKKGIRVHEHVLLSPVVGTIIELAMREEINLAALPGEAAFCRSLNRD